MRCGYDSCLPSLLEQVVLSIRQCDAEYNSDVDMKLNSYESSVQQSVHSIMASIDLSLEHFGPRGAPIDLQ